MGGSLPVDPVVLGVGFGVAFISGVLAGLHPSIQKSMGFFISIGAGN